LAVHRFLCQFPVEFDPVANIGVTTRDLIAALRQIAKKDEVSPRMAATLDGIEAGLGTVELDPIPLFEAGDKAFHFYKSLNDELAARWVLAKDCFVMRSLFERRARISDLHAKIVGAKRSSVAAETSAEQTASMRPAAGPIVYQPQPVAEVTTVVVPQALVGTARAEDEFDLAAELERASVAANTARIGKGDGTVTDTLSPEEIAARHMELSQAFADSELDALDALTAELEEAVGWRR
jgi:hypothetical protein